MGYIGKVPTAVPITTSDLADGIVTTSKLANDSVDNTKLDLTDNYAFTGTVSGAGSLNLIETKTISGGQSTIDFTSGISSSYDMYMWHVIGVDIDQDSNFQIQISTNGGSSYVTGASEYDYAVRGYNSNNAFGTSVAVSDSHINCTFSGSPADDSINHPLNLIIYMSDHANSSARTTFWGNIGNVTQSGYATGGYFCGSVRTTSNNPNAVRFKMGSGTFDLGKVKMYGIS